MFYKLLLLTLCIGANALAMEGYKPKSPFNTINREFKKESIHSNTDRQINYNEMYENLSLEEKKALCNQLSPEEKEKNEKKWLEKKAIKEKEENDRAKKRLSRENREIYISLGISATVITVSSIFYLMYPREIGEAAILLRMLILGK